MRVILYSLIFVFWGIIQCCFGAVSIDGNSSQHRAVIISTKNFHFEVAAVFAYHLNSMGIEPHIFVGPTVLGGGDYMGVGDWLRTYTPHLYNFNKRNQVNPVLLEHAQSKVLIIVTSDEFPDFKNLCLHPGLYNTLYAGAERVLLVMHNANSTLYLAQRCQDPKCNLVVLGENVYNSSRAILSQHGMNHVNLRWMSSIHPLASQYIAPRGTSGATRFIMQGILTPDNRRDFNRLFDCMMDVKKNHQIELVLIGRVAPTGPNLTIPLNLENITTVVRFPNYVDYFHYTSSSDYAILFSKYDFYDHSRITSSIPTSVVSNLPIIFPEKLLSDYACMRDQRIHKQISSDDECGSVKAALALRPEQKQQMRDEVAFCTKQLLMESNSTLFDIIFGDGASSISSKTAANAQHSAYRFCSK